MLTEAIILAGGLGTRLRSVSGEKPKPIIEVAGRPFIYYIFDGLISQNITRVVIAISYKSDVFISEIGNSYQGLDIQYSIEHEALGTGGAIAQAMDHCITDHVLITNGDTYLDIDLLSYFNSHTSSGKSISMALVRVEDVARYGSVTCRDNKIISFNEKGNAGEGYINGGMYLFTRKDVLLPVEKFSFEEIVLKQQYMDINPFECGGFFIDIGIPDDYYKACDVFKR